MWHIQMSPVRHLHFLPFAECVQAEVQQPLRLLFPRGNHTHDVLIQALRYKVLVDIRHEAFLVFFLRYVLKQFLLFVNIHNKYLVSVISCYQIPTSSPTP